MKAFNTKLFQVSIVSSTNYINVNEVDFFIQAYTPRLAISTKAGDYQATLSYVCKLCRDYIRMKKIGIIIIQVYTIIIGIFHVKKYMGVEREIRGEKREDIYHLKYQFPL